MELNDVLDFIKKNHDLKSLELQEGDFSIKIEWNVGGAQAVSHPVQAEVRQTAESDEEATNLIPGGHDNAKNVLSPLVGTYHDLEGARKISIGSRLKKGDALCNIEAMKLMNEIVIPEDGEIVWMACAEGDTVEYDQLLFRYE